MMPGFFAFFALCGDLRKAREVKQRLAAFSTCIPL